MNRETPRTPALLQQLEHEREVVRMNALHAKYLRAPLVIRQEGLVAYQHRAEQHRQSERRRRLLRPGARRAALRDEWRVCVPCGQSWPGAEGRQCRSCGHVGEVA